MLAVFFLVLKQSKKVDFFTNRSLRYAFAIKNIKRVLQNNFQLIVEVESKDFTRFKINDLLQVDFVNDIAFRYKDIVVNEDNYLLDNIVLS